MPVSGIISWEKLESGEIMRIDSQVPVSVIIPCFNCEGTIIRAVNSISNQTSQPKEVILIDDGSTDESLSRLHEIRDHLGSSWIKILKIGNNKGPSVARNAGWNVAAQPYLAFLDADDIWHPRKIEIQYKCMQGNPEIAISGHHFRWLREGENPLSMPDIYAIKSVSKRMMLVSNYWATPTVMLKRDLKQRFEPTKRHSEDYLLWLKIICNGYRANHIDLCMAYSYKAPYGSRGLSGQLWAMEIGELDTYRRLRDDRLISWPWYIALSTFSVIKYLRRTMISAKRGICNEP